MTLHEGMWRRYHGKQLEDAQRAHSALQQQYGELSADYKHVLGQLWKANAGMVRRDR